MSPDAGARAPRRHALRYCAAPRRGLRALMSTPRPRAFGKACNRATRIAPVPVPKSRISSGAVSRPSSRKTWIAASTNVSVSGRGSRVAGDISRSRSMNPRRPRMRETGSRRRRRSRHASSRTRSCAVKTRWDSASTCAPDKPHPAAARRRASRRKLSTPAARSTEAVSLTQSANMSGSSSMLTTLYHPPWPPAGWPDARSQAHRSTRRERRLPRRRRACAA